MSLKHSILLVPSIIVLGSVLLGLYVSPNWFWLTGIMGAHLIKVSFTELSAVVVAMQELDLKARTGWTSETLPENLRSRASCIRLLCPALPRRSTTSP